MPEISRFFGIVILVNYNDHSPPHFHAQYGDEEILVKINDLSTLRGSMSSHAKNLIMKWATIHKEELLNAWNAAQAHTKPERIDPLPNS